MKKNNHGRIHKITYFPVTLNRNGKDRNNYNKKESDSTWLRKELKQRDML